MTPQQHPGDLDPATAAALDDWVRAGLVSAEQARRIRDHDRVPAAGTPAPPRVSVVGEALGYVGGAIVLAGTGILVGYLWADLAPVARLLLAAGAVAVLVLGGWAVPDGLGGPATRLRAVLWALGVGAAAGMCAIWSTEFLDRSDEQALIVIFPPTAALAAVLWWLRTTWLQQLVLLTALALTASAIGWEITGTDTAPPLATWALAVGWSVLAWVGLLPPRSTGLIFGGVVAVVGAAATPGALGIVLGLLTAGLLLAVALAGRSLPLIAVSAFGMLMVAPRAAVEWLPGPVSAALSLITVGALLVGAAIWVARRKDPVPDSPRNHTLAHRRE